MAELLVAHPDFPPSRVRAVTVEWSALDARSGGESEGNRLIRFVVEGAAELVIPERRSPIRTNDLWQHSCFELFVNHRPGGGYAEYNFAPSGEWAAYEFDGYRSGMRDLAFPPPAIDGIYVDGRYELRVHVDAAILPTTGAVFVPTAVIEEAGGIKSFWALRHPSGPPDFHHAACFPK